MHFYHFQQVDDLIALKTKKKQFMLVLNRNYNHEHSNAEMKKKLFWDVMEITSNFTLWSQHEFSLLPISSFILLPWLWSKLKWQNEKFVTERNFAKSCGSKTKIFFYWTNASNMKLTLERKFSLFCTV